MILRVGDKVQIKNIFASFMYTIEKMYYSKDGSYAMLEESRELEFLTDLVKLEDEIKTEI